MRISRTLADVDGGEGKGKRIFDRIFRIRGFNFSGPSLKDGISAGIFFYNLQNIPPRNFLSKTKKVHLIKNFIFYTMLKMNLQNSNYHESRKRNFVN
jgi:hypothetical protein